MTLLRHIAEIVAHWLDAVAAALVGAIGRVVSPRVVRLVEQEDGSGFALYLPKDAQARPDRLRFGEAGPEGAVPETAAKAIRGNRVEIVLDSSRFVFRPLELPRRAVEFLDGIIRAQIDRLTPWSANDAVFGWGRPADIASDRISVMVRPILQGVSALGAESVAVLTAPAGGPDAARIKVYDQSVRGRLDAQRVSRILLVVLMIAMCAAVLAVALDTIVGGQLDAQASDLARRINERRVLLHAGPRGVAQSASALLDRRKQETPAAVIVIEALSAILPDETYVTELRIEGNKLQIIGVTRDAPGLIRLIEQSPHFARATFFAPTTRSPTDPGDRFHIEARIEPVNTPRS
jgi:general secretion pathway protein L